MIVIPDASGREVLSFGDRVKAIMRKPCISHRPKKSLDVGVLLQLSGLAIFTPNILVFRPFEDGRTQVFRAITQRKTFGLPRHSMS